MNANGQWGFLVLVVVASACSSSCSPSVRIVKHSPSMAAKAAQEFAVTAFVERDAKNAHRQLATQTQLAYDQGTIEVAIATIHSTGYPSTVAVTEYEPIPAQSAINIFLLGESATEKFYYRLLMEGTQSTGYRVSGFWRGSGPYPPSNLRRPFNREEGRESKGSSLKEFGPKKGSGVFNPVRSAT